MLQVFLFHLFLLTTNVHILLYIKCLFLRINSQYIMKYLPNKTVRGRPARNNATESNNIALFHAQTQNQALISSFILTYVHAILNQQERTESQNSYIDQSVKQNGFEWLANLPKVFYQSSQQFQKELKQKIQRNENGNEQGTSMQILKDDEILFNFIKSISQLELKSVVNQIRNVAVNFVVSSKFHRSPEQALHNLRRFYLEEFKPQNMNKEFRYCRFNLPYISQVHRNIIDNNLKEYWKGFILIITKIMFIVSTQGCVQSHLLRLYSCNEDKKDLQIFKQVIEVEQILYLKWQYENLIKLDSSYVQQADDLKQKVDVATGQGMEDQQHDSQAHIKERSERLNGNFSRVNLLMEQQQQGIDMAKQLEMDSEDSQEQQLEKTKRIRKL